MRMTIAVDGPAGSGKSTIAKLIAVRHGINYMDTGAMYRAIALALTERGVDLKDAHAVKSALPEIDISVVYEEGRQCVCISGRDVSGLIRTPEMSKGASDVAVIPEVRLKLVEIQRAAAEGFDIVMDGRDIGSYVLPDAPLKIFLTASSRVRAERRHKELMLAGVETDLVELQKQIEARDQTDTTRVFAPLKRAEDAIYIDTTDMDIDEVASVIEKKIEEVFS